MCEQIKSFLFYQDFSWVLNFNVKHHACCKTHEIIEKFWFFFVFFYKSETLFHICEQINSFYFISLRWREMYFNVTHLARHMKSSKNIWKVRVQLALNELCNPSFAVNWNFLLIPVPPPFHSFVFETSLLLCVSFKFLNNCILHCRILERSFHYIHGLSRAPAHKSSTFLFSFKICELYLAFCFV